MADSELHLLHASECMQQSKNLNLDYALAANKNHSSNTKNCLAFCALNEKPYYYMALFFYINTFYKYLADECFGVCFVRFKSVCGSVQFETDRNRCTLQMFSLD